METSLGASNVDHLRAFYDVMVSCGLTVPPWEAWKAHASENAELWPIIKGGELVGGIFFKGQTIHIAVRPDWQGRWITPTILRAFRQWQHECEIVATPPQDNKAACALAERVGFKFRAPHRQFRVYAKEPTTCHQQSSPQS